jgi:phosphatidylserine/phosphatidylglycerophosphate/cardiolipin synthase-like enzyme
VDPTLRRLIESGDVDDEVAVLVRLSSAAATLPRPARIVTRFGDIATVRVPRGQVERLRTRPAVRSVKAPRLYRAEVVLTKVGLSPAETDLEPTAADERRPPGLTATGAGAVVAVVDWGLDFTHPDFRHPDGRTRLLALWDQQPGPDPARPNRYGYGLVYTAAAINAALEQPDPVAALGYDPALSDLGLGTHGTATTSIAAGSGASGVPGVAPEADLVFVHLSTWGPAGPQGLGDSVALVEAIDFIRQTAGDRPWVVNLSMGRHGGPHDGSTLVEQALDAVMAEGPGRMIIQSCGNYYAAAVHVEGELLPGRRTRIPLLVDPAAQEEHQVELWYAGSDRMAAGLLPPDGGRGVITRPGQDKTLRLGGEPAARIIHRTGDPNNGRNQVVIWLFPGVPGGEWVIVLGAADVTDGRYHAWVERESLHPRCQARFPGDLAVSTTTTGTICNGQRTITVGAYDRHSPDWAVTVFSSSGPTVDGRHKPDLLAPGQRVLVARSQPAGPAQPDQTGPDRTGLGTRMNGTSMAAPHVTGTVACLFQVLGGLPAAAWVRALVLESCRPYGAEDAFRAGNGYLDLAASIAAASNNTAAVGNASAPGSQPAPQREDLMIVPTEAATLVPTADQTPGEILASLETTAYELFEVFVLGRKPELRARLERRVELVAGPYDQVDGLRAGDLLIRGHTGEGHALAAVLTDGKLADPAAARELGWTMEGRLPGRYAWVVDRYHARDEHWARRVADRRGFVTADQAVLRLIPEPELQPQEGLTEAITPVTALTSPRFAGDTDLDAVAKGTLRLAAPGTSSYPAPVLSRGPAITKVQQALIDLGYPLPKFGADSRFGGETAAAVARYKTDRSITPNDPVVGRLTMASLNTDIVAHDGPVPPPPPPPPPPGPTLSGLEGRYFPPPGGKDSADFTREATIEPLIDGVTFFAAIKAELDRLTAGDVCYIAGWWVDSGFRFAPPAGPTLQDILVSKVTAGVDVRVILWANKNLLDNPGLVTRFGLGGFLNVTLSNVRAAESLRAAAAPGGGTPLSGRVLLDWSGNAASSHHMKISVFSHEGQFTAFAGGIDYRQDRLDGPPHRHAFTRPDGSTFTWGWHDAGAQLTGRAAGAVFTTFLTRWTEASTLSAATYDIGAGRRPYNPPPIAPILPRPVPSAPASPDTSVEVVRSFPDSKEFRLIRNVPWTTLPSDGVHETRLTFRTAIAAAQRYIYIEDQAFTATDSLFPALVAACKRNVKVIAVLPGTADPNDGAAGPANQALSNEVVTGLLAKLTPAEQQNVAVWRLDNITVHSKLMLIDDEFLEIGSANFMDRSMQFTGKGDDSELTACAVSTGSLVRDLRVQLWAEHLQVSDPAALTEIQDLSKSLGFWRPAWGTGITFPHPSSPLAFVGPPSAPIPPAPRKSGSSS